MYRVTKMSGNFYAIEISEDDKLEEQMQEIFNFAKDGIPCIVVDELLDLESMDIYDKVELVNV